MDFSIPPSKLRFIDSWFLMGSPVPLIAIFTFYFCFLSIAPKLMKDRKPFDLTKVIRAYNIFQVVSCIAFIISAYKQEYYVFSSTWKCMKFEDQNNYHTRVYDIFNLYWYFMILRTTELLETMFFILRKKQDQVSFLHVYHHVSTIVFLYLLNRYSASMMELYIAMLNNCVHILMYAYYFASSFPAARNVVKKLKPIMTTIQIGQLVLILGQCFVAKACGYSSLFYIFAINLVVLIFFFTKFYVENYFSKKNNAKKIK